MHAASSLSRRFLTAWSTAATLLLGLLLCGWLLLGLAWVLLHGWIVPRIDDFRPQLQTLVAQATGLRVEIGQLSARSNGVFPSFELRQVRLLDAAGRPVLLLPQVQAALSPRSVLTLGLEQLVVRDAELDVRRTADGRLLLAGVPIWPAGPQQDQALADWLLAQREWALLGGTVRWTDEQRGVALTLSQVDAVMRNPGQRHSFRLDATPPADWGERFSLRGIFKERLLSRSSSDWQQWSGQLYGAFSRIDLSPMQPYARLAGVRLGEGRGALRTWVDVANGRIVGATADVALDDAQARLAPQLQPLAFRRLAGRLSWQDKDDQGLSFQSEALGFETRDGLHWPGGNVSLNIALDEQGQTTGGQLKADRLDLQALAAISQRLPLPQDWRRLLQVRAPQGLVDHLEARWDGALEAPRQFSALGRVSNLTLAAETASGQNHPGLAGMSLDFRLQREGGEDKGQASFRLDQGWLEFPGVFEEARIPLERFTGELRFKRNTGGTEVELRQGALQAHDAQGQFQATWRQAASGDRLGSLDLQGQLGRADGSRVWRYLPLGVSESVRHYVRDAVVQGQLSQVRFKVKGPLASFPYGQTPNGEFQVSARLHNALYHYVPTVQQPAGSKPWPALTQMDAELLFDRSSLQIRRAQARVADLPGLALSKVEARIPDMGRQPVVQVSGEIKGPLNQALALINQSPVGEMTRQVLAQATATGPAETQLQLQLPLADLAKATVQGSVTLAGNDLQLAPEAPAMGRVRGLVSFSESGFQVSNAQARMLGGEVRFDGGMPETRRSDEPTVLLRGQGTASVEGLQQWRELAGLAPLLRQASGSAAYSATLGFRQGAVEWDVSSNLSGVALDLPEPLHKPASTSLPLRLEKTVLRESLAPGRRLQDRLSLNVGPGGPLGRPLAVRYWRDIADDKPQVLGGLVSLGAEREGETPVRGEVRAQLQLPRLDLDAWEALLNLGGGEDSSASAAASAAYLPTAFSLRTGTLKLQGHAFQEVVLDGRREGKLWRAQVKATELSGHGEYRQPSGSTPGRLFARLSRLSLGHGTASEVEALLESQPSSIPALDIVVDDLELRGRRLGRLEVEAVNRHLAGRDATREWRLNKLNLSVPEATLWATGSWAARPAAGTSGRGGAARRGTSLDFRLDVADSGELLKRLGLEGAIRRGKGRLEGQLSWNGSPLGLHHPSLQGKMAVDVASGQFLKAEPGAAKLLGVLNLQALPRRLMLDFRDVFSEGFAFDWIRGDVHIEQGVASTDNLRMKGVNAAVLMQGSADIAQETQDLRVVVVPEINAGAASLLAYAVNPAMALSTFVAQWLLRYPLNDANTQEFHILGTWKDPQIQRVSRERAAALDSPGRGESAR